MESHDQRIQTGALALQTREYPHPGETIIFLHFGGGNLRMWQPAVVYFQAHYRLLLVDLRDHGRSDKPQAGDDMDTLATDLAGLMDSMHLEQAHVVGSSLGAEVGLSLAANYPARVSSLVCEGALYSEFGPYGSWDGTQAEFEAYAAEMMEKIHAREESTYPSIQAFLEAKRANFEPRGWWNEAMASFFEYDAFEVSAGRFTRSLPKRAQEIYMQSYFACRFEDYYSRVECPLWMLPDEEDWGNERLQAAMLGLSKLARRAQIVPLKGWTHPYGWLLNPEVACSVALRALGAPG